ncbi:MAG: Nif3-like dinuclear metal center hexameric protein [Clostridia bacterium]|nr:Nif3-like dinuclear metal center hexameric protein [Clostridia bacterium]
MTTLRSLYEYLSYRLPEELREEWDNDGVMVMGEDRRVSRVLVTLDITKEAVDYAAANNFGLIVSHHPLIFHPLRGVTDPRIIALIRGGTAAFSFHTRLDVVEGGVNDTLCELLGIKEVTARGMLRVGEFPQELTHDEFARLLKSRLGCEKLTYVERTPRVRRVAVLGGDGKDEYAEAVASGADTYLTGNMSYNTMTDAAAGPINVYEAGHFETEFPVCRTLCDMIGEFDPSVYCEIFRSNQIKTL